MSLKNVTIGGMIGDVQLGAPERFWQGEKFGRKDVSRFEVRAGDVSVGGDAPNHRERCEFRSQTEDPTGDSTDNLKWVRYNWDYLLPEDYHFMTPKQTLGQLFDEHNGEPILFMRLEHQQLELFINSKLPDAPKMNRFLVPFVIGKWNRLKLEAKWGRGSKGASFRLVSGSKEIVRMKDVSLIKPTAENIYFKFGVYRSDMDDWARDHPFGEPAPTLAVYYSKVARKVLPRAPF